MNLTQRRYVVKRIEQIAEVHKNKVDVAVREKYGDYSRPTWTAEEIKKNIVSGKWKPIKGKRTEYNLYAVFKVEEDDKTNWREEGRKLKEKIMEEARALQDVIMLEEAGDKVNKMLASFSSKKWEL